MKIQVKYKKLDPVIKIHLKFKNSIQYETQHNNENLDPMIKLHSNVKTRHKLYFQILKTRLNDENINPIIIFLFIFSNF